MKKSIPVLKSYFETGDKPTQQQFYDFLESFLHLDSYILVSQVTGLETALETLNTLGISDVAGLQTALNDLNTAIATLEIADVSGLQGILDTLAVVAIGDVTGLQAVLDGLATRGIGDITGLADALNGKVDKVAGYGLSKNDFSDYYVGLITTIQNAVTALTYEGVVTEATIIKTLALTDVNKRIKFTNANPIALTVPLDASVAWYSGTKIKGTVQGNGAVTISGAGITFVGNTLTFPKGESFTLINTGLNEWTVEGNAPVAGALEFKKCYLKASGNDTTAVIGSGDMPFLTLDGLIAKFMTVYGNTDNLQIIILDSGTYTVTTQRTITDFMVYTNFSPVVKITEATIYTGNLILEGKMEFIIDPKVGCVTSQQSFFRGDSSNGISSINIRKFNTGNTGYTPTLHWKIEHTISMQKFNIDECASLGRFWCNNVQRTEINIPLLTGYLPEILHGNNTVNVGNIYYTGSGVFDIHLNTNFAGKLRIGSSTCTNSAGSIGLYFGNKTIELMGGIFQNTTFQGVGNSSTSVGNMLTGTGILEWKKAINFYGIIGFSNVGGQRNNRLTMNLLKDLTLTIRDTNAGAYLNAGNIFGMWCGAGNAASAKAIFQNVFVEVQQSTCALFMIDINASLETADQYIAIFKGSCQFISNGYFAKTRGQGFVFTGYKSLVKIGNCVNHIGGLGLAVETDITMTNISTY